MIKRAKYNSKKTLAHGYLFDSTDEAKFFSHLLGMKIADECLNPTDRRTIVNIELQPKYTLIPKFKYFGETRREMSYTPDFRVAYSDGTTELFDCKGFSSQQGDIRRKLFEYKYPYEKLIWITRNIKHGDKDGWIEYDELKKVRAKAKKEKTI